MLEKNGFEEELMNIIPPSWKVLDLRTMLGIEVFIIMLKLKRVIEILLWRKKRKNLNNSLISLTSHLMVGKNLILSSKLRFGLNITLILLFVLKGIIISKSF